MEIERAGRRLSFPPAREKEFQQEHARQTLTAVRLGLASIFVLVLGFGVLDALTAPQEWRLMARIRFGILCPVTLAFLALTFTGFYVRHRRGLLTAYTLITGISVSLLSMLPSPPARFLHYPGVLLVLTGAYAFSQSGFFRITAACWAISIVHLIVGQRYGFLPPDVLITNAFFLTAFNALGMVACYTGEVFVRRDFLQRREIETERERAENLLRNILPEAIATRLKRDTNAIADAFAEVTVLFADIAEFTPLASRLSPTEVVYLLNTVFTRFDALAEKHGLEKIKTIGDAYMAVGGLPDPRPDHAEAIAQMALDMQEAVRQITEETGLPVGLKIGINTGPVVAGVIGTKKFIYDLWGDTVNIASRLEGQGVAGSIYLTEATRARLPDRFLIADRGEIAIKGRGMMNAFVLTGERTSCGSEDAAASASDAAASYPA